MPEQHRGQRSGPARIDDEAAAEFRIDFILNPEAAGRHTRWLLRPDDMNSFPLLRCLLLSLALCHGAVPGLGMGCGDGWSGFDLPSTRAQQAGDRDHLASHRLDLIERSAEGEQTEQEPDETNSSSRQLFAARRGLRTKSRTVPRPTLRCLILASTTSMLMVIPAAPPATRVSASRGPGRSGQDACILLQTWRC